MMNIISKLEILNAEYNFLTELPISLGKLYKLIELKMGINPGLSEHPASFNRPSLEISGFEGVFESE